jgi:Uncharacterized protein conserved in bacteria
MVAKTREGEEFAVLNLQGRVFMPTTDDPFRAADAELAKLSKRRESDICRHAWRSDVGKSRDGLVSGWACFRRDWNAHAYSHCGRNHTARRHGVSDRRGDDGTVHVCHRRDEGRRDSPFSDADTGKIRIRITGCAVEWDSDRRGFVDGESADVSKEFIADNHL